MYSYPSIDSRSSGQDAGQRSPIRMNYGAPDPFSDTHIASTISSSSEIEHISPAFGSSTSESEPRSPPHAFRSYKLQGKFEQPWLSDPRLKRASRGNYIIWGFIVAALGLSVYLNYRAVKKVSVHDYCLVLDEQFQSLSEDVWNHEVQVNGYGNGEFEWTTTDAKNSFVDAEGLHIVPTLTTDSTDITKDQIFEGFTLNLTKSGGDGTCTGTKPKDCGAISNLTSNSIIPPVRSARLNTKGKKSIKYGRVEVIAKLPQGDWIWPAIWMMPENNTYGEWPASGEIDLVESRGNGVEYGVGGRDVIGSTLHWGPSSATDMFWKTTRGKALRRTDFSKGYHTFGIEWSKDYLFTYLDSRLQQVLYMNFRGSKTLWDRGDFASKVDNGVLLQNPWNTTGNTNSPFDQPFYLILNVAVGSQGGWFPDGKGKKPWADSSGSAASDFYKAIDKWLPTWGKGKDAGMTVKSVKMWQEGKCGS